MDRRRGPDALSAILDCAGVAQTHIQRIIAFPDRVIMRARGPISTFSIFLCFCDCLRRRFGLRRRNPYTHFNENCTELLVFGRASLDKAFGSVISSAATAAIAAIVALAWLAWFDGLPCTAC